MNTVTSRDGTTIAFDRFGAGPALILVGGALQCRAIDPQTAQLAALLAPHFTVFHYDRRGRGDSGDTAPYAKEREIEDLASLIEEAGVPVVVFGNSSGGNLALEAAARGLAIAKLALWEPNFLVDDSRSPLPTDYVAQLTALVAAGHRGDAVEFFLTSGVGVPAEIVASMRQQPFWPAFEAVAHTLAYDGAIVADSMSGKAMAAERYASVTIPTLVLDGGQTAWMSQGADVLAAVLPSAQRRTLHDQPHGVAPAVIAPVLEEFFVI